jgi:hypothetical protein
MRDLAEFDSYGRVKIPVCEGDVKGEVRSFIHNGRSAEQIGAYVLGLKDLIDKQKYLDSVIARGDIGPAKAIANAIEYGHHQRFLEDISTNSGLELNGIEKTLEVKEGEDIYHILPKDSLISLKCVEQRGLVIFHLYRRFQESGMYDKREAAEWVKNNCGPFRDLMIDCKPKEKEYLFGYSNCDIFKNLCKRTIEKFVIDSEILERIDAKQAIEAYATAEQVVAVA